MSRCSGVVARSLDEELDRLAEKYGTEYLAEHLLNHPSDLATIRLRASWSEYEAKYMKKEPLDQVVTGKPTLPAECAVDVLQRFLIAGEYFSPEVGTSPTMELAVADAVIYVKQL